MTEQPPSTEALAVAAPRNFTGERPGHGWKISDETQRELEAMDNSLRGIGVEQRTQYSDPQPTTTSAPSSAEIKAAKDWYWHHGEGNRPREDEFFLHLARYAAATAPSPPAVVDYTERADAVANELVKAGLIPDQGGLFIPIRAKIAAAIAAVASEHRAALHEARQAWLAIEAHRNQLAAKLARLGEPEMREAVKRALEPYLHDAITRMARDEAADAALAVITEKLNG